MTLQDDEVKARVSDRGTDWLTIAYTEPPSKNQDSGAAGGNHAAFRPRPRLPVPCSCHRRGSLN